MDPEKSAFKYKSTIPLRWSDVDELGHVNNAVYLTYLEEARINYFADVLQWDWKKTGLILAKSVIDYKMPLYATNTLRIYSRISRMGTKSFDMEYLLLNEQEQLIATALTVLVVFDYETQHSQEIPAGIREVIKHFEGNAG